MTRLWIWMSGLDQRRSSRDMPACVSLHQWLRSLVDVGREGYSYIVVGHFVPRTVCNNVDVGSRTLLLLLLNVWPQSQCRRVNACSVVVGCALDGRRFAPFFAVQIIYIGKRGDKENGFLLLVLSDNNAWDTNKSILLCIIFPLFSIF